VKIQHIFSALLVAAIWGLSFVVVEIGLRHYPPMLLAALRFAIVFVIGIFFFPKPLVSWRIYIKVGFFLGIIQFACLFSAINLGVPAGIVSVLAQLQVFLTILLSILLLREKRSFMLYCIVTIAFLGVLLLASARYQNALPIFPIGLALIGAGGFAWGNIELKRIGKIDMFSFTVWMSAVPPIPLLILSTFLEGGPSRIIEAITHMSLSGLFSLFFLSVIGTLYALGTWGKLLSLYPAKVVAPFYLASPVFGLWGGWYILHERYDWLSILASCLIFSALALNTYASFRMSRNLPADPSPTFTSKR
jgi:O-acetylserine/cysteine efflux transporter